VPAVILGDRVVHGWNPAAYAELVGVTWKPETRFTTADLAARLDTILDTTQRLIQGLLVETLDWKPPERDRTVRDLGYHVFRLSLGFADGMDLGRFPAEWHGETAPPDLVDGAAVARYGALVRGRLAGWFEGAGPDEYSRVIDVYYGPQSGYDLLERTTWHAGQHLRQLHALAERLDFTPPALPADALRGLPMPEALW
jgi:hypothetical protein